MTNKEILQELKKFQLTGTKDEIFKIHNYLLAWINNVAPLLKEYDTQHYNNFTKAAQIVSVRNISPYNAIPCLNILKNTVDQAITELEMSIAELKLTRKALKKKENKSNSHWYQKPYGIIILTVVSGFIIFIIKILFTHYFLQENNND